MFDIHKVKPIHGWREFIGEVGIIVLGVLIALGFEQIVEAAHWYRKVNETKETLLDSVESQVLPAIEQQVVAPCVSQQLNALETRLYASGRYRPVRLNNDASGISYVIRTPSRPWNDTVWTTVTGEGVSTHYDSDFRDLMDRFYTTLAITRDIARQIDRLSARLNALSFPVAKDPTIITQYTQDIEEFRAREAYMTLASDTLLGFAAHAKMLPSSERIRALVYRGSGTIAFCREHRLPLGRPHANDPWLSNFQK